MRGALVRFLGGGRVWTEEAIRTSQQTAVFLNVWIVLGLGPSMVGKGQLPQACRPNTRVSSQRRLKAVTTIRELNRPILKMQVLISADKPNLFP